MSDLIIQPKRPAQGSGWIKVQDMPPDFNLGYGGEMWAYPPQHLCVISAVEAPRDPGQLDLGPQYHVSVSRNQQRCNRNEARFAMKAFGMLDAEEDNHVPGGFVRNFWMPVADRFVGYVCPCVDDEPAMVEDKGDFVWRGITK
jgi:hypothetical protein